MILQKCGNCLSLFEAQNEDIRYCPECGPTKHRMPTEQRIARAERAKKVCPECKTTFTMADVGLDPTSGHDRRAWNSRTRCRKEKCEEVAWQRLLEGYKRKRNPKPLEEESLNSHVKSLLQDLGAVPRGGRDPRHAQYEQMMGKRR